MVFGLFCLHETFNVVSMGLLKHTMYAHYKKQDFMKVVILLFVYTFYTMVYYVEIKTMRTCRERTSKD